MAIQKLPVRFAIDRAGLVGADGATHAGSFDVGYLARCPASWSWAPSDEAELTQAWSPPPRPSTTAPAFRYPRGEGTGVQIPLLAATARDRQGPDRARGDGGRHPVVRHPPAARR